MQSVVRLHTAGGGSSSWKPKMTTTQRWDQPTASASACKLIDINEHLLCALCSGYLIDATTIIECLHTFCRSCIVRYLESSETCPVCDVPLHQTNPLLGIRLDITLQTLVFKLVPGVFKDEVKRRCNVINNAHADGKRPSITDRLLKDICDMTTGGTIYTGDEKFSICLQYSPDGASKKKGDSQLQQPVFTGNSKNRSECWTEYSYLLCPASVTIAHLKKLLRNKLELTDDFPVELFHSTVDNSLDDRYSMADVAYITEWINVKPLHFLYRVVAKCSKISNAETIFSPQIDSKTRFSQDNSKSSQRNKIPMKRIVCTKTKKVKLKAVKLSTVKGKSLKKKKTKVKGASLESKSVFCDDVISKCSSKPETSSDCSSKLDNAFSKLLVENTSIVEENETTLDNSKAKCCEENEEVGKDSHEGSKIFARTKDDLEEMFNDRLIQKTTKRANIEETDDASVSPARRRPTRCMHFADSALSPSRPEGVVAIAVDSSGFNVDVLSEADASACIDSASSPPHKSCRVEPPTTNDRNLFAAINSMMSNNDNVVSSSTSSQVSADDSSDSSGNKTSVETQTNVKLFGSCRMKKAKLQRSRKDSLKSRPLKTTSQNDNVHLQEKMDAGIVQKVKNGDSSTGSAYTPDHQTISVEAQTNKGTTTSTHGPPPTLCLPLCIGDKGSNLILNLPQNVSLQCSFRSDKILIASNSTANNPEIVSVVSSVSYSSKTTTISTKDNMADSLDNAPPNASDTTPPPPPTSAAGDLRSTTTPPSRQTNDDERSSKSIDIISNSVSSVDDNVPTNVVHKTTDDSCLLTASASYNNSSTSSAVEGNNWLSDEGKSSQTVGDVRLECGSDACVLSPAGRVDRNSLTDKFNATEKQGKSVITITASAATLGQTDMKGSLLSDRCLKDAAGIERKRKRERSDGTVNIINTASHQNLIYGDRKVGLVSNKAGIRLLKSKEESKVTSPSEQGITKTIERGVSQATSPSKDHICENTDTNKTSNVVLFKPYQIGTTSYSTLVRQTTPSTVMSKSLNIESILTTSSTSPYFTQDKRTVHCCDPNISNVRSCRSLLTDSDGKCATGSDAEKCKTGISAVHCTMSNIPFHNVIKVPVYTASYRKTPTNSRKLDKKVNSETMKNDGNIASCSITLNSSNKFKIFNSNATPTVSLSKNETAVVSLVDSDRNTFSASSSAVPKINLTLKEHQPILLLPPLKELAVPVKLFSNVKDVRENPPNVSQSILKEDFGTKTFSTIVDKSENNVSNDCTCYKDEIDNKSDVSSASCTNAKSNTSSKNYTSCKGDTFSISKSIDKSKTIELEKRKKCHTPKRSCSVLDTSKSEPNRESKERRRTITDKPCDEISYTCAEADSGTSPKMARTSSPSRCSPRKVREESGAATNILHSSTGNSIRKKLIVDLDRCTLKPEKTKCNTSSATKRTSQVLDSCSPTTTNSNHGHQHELSNQQHTRLIVSLPRCPVPSSPTTSQELNPKQTSPTSSNPILPAGSGGNSPQTAKRLKLMCNGMTLYRTLETNEPRRRRKSSNSGRNSSSPRSHGSVIGSPGSSGSVPAVICSSSKTPASEIGSKCPAQSKYRRKSNFEKNSKEETSASVRVDYTLKSSITSAIKLDATSNYSLTTSASCSSPSFSSSFSSLSSASPFSSPSFSSTYLTLSSFPSPLLSSTCFPTPPFSSYSSSSNNNNSFCAESPWKRLERSVSVPFSPATMDQPLELTTKKVQERQKEKQYEKLVQDLSTNSTFTT